MCLQLYDQALLKVNTYVSDNLIICLVITIISKFVFRHNWDPVLQNFISEWFPFWKWDKRVIWLYF